METLNIISGTKTEIYDELYKQIKAVVEAEDDTIANMANVASMIHETFKFWWTGFYRVITDDQLVLGPFQGPLACTRIKKGRGVCGTAWSENRTLIVPDVDKFPGHIACSMLSKSEIVVPVHDNQGNVKAVLDIDSEKFDNFDNDDLIGLERICKLL